ncbi:MAG: hypothetical protein HDQ95_06705 [Roseburia sp.]|nr:hypothetical protein [Roseburia sp.]
MKDSFSRNGKIILLALFCLTLAGCAADTENRQESNALKESEESASEIGDSAEEIESNSAISTEDLNTWIGKYTFFESCNEPDYPPMVMEFEITIYENGYADIYVNGQTTFIQIRAKVYGSSEQISFVFSERLPGDATSREWDSSDVLLYFKKDGDDIYTYWGELKDTVLLYSDQISGEIYFVKEVDKND